MTLLRSIGTFCAGALTYVVAASKLREFQCRVAKEGTKEECDRQIGLLLFFRCPERLRTFFDRMPDSNFSRSQIRAISSSRLSREEKISLETVVEQKLKTIKEREQNFWNRPRLSQSDPERP